MSRKSRSSIGSGMVNPSNVLCTRCLLARRELTGPVPSTLAPRAWLVVRRLVVSRSRRLCLLRPRLGDDPRTISQRTGTPHVSQLCLPESLQMYAKQRVGWCTGWHVQEAGCSVPLLHAVLVHGQQYRAHGAVGVSDARRLRVGVRVHVRARRAVGGISHAAIRKVRSTSGGNVLLKMVQCRDSFRHLIPVYRASARYKPLGMSNYEQVRCIASSVLQNSPG